MSDVLAFDPARRTSAQAILDLVTLGYLDDDQLTLDATYGLGRFWAKWRPVHLWTNDINPERETDFHIDYRSLPRGESFTCRGVSLPGADWTDLYDVTVFDPPFKLGGTSAHASDNAYGVDDDWAGTTGRMAGIHAGIRECIRVTKPGGLFLMKCQDQVSGGHVRWQSREFTDCAEQLGCRLIDMIFIVGGIPQPAGRRQVHARRGYSSLLIMRKLP